MYKKATLLALCTVFTLSGCLTLAKVAAPLFIDLFLKDKKECQRSNFTEERPAPKWICTLPESKIGTGAYGVGSQWAGGSLSMQNSLARLHGRKQIALALQAQIVVDLRETVLLTRALKKIDDSLTDEEIDSLVLASVTLENFLSTENIVQRTQGLLVGVYEVENVEAPIDRTIYSLMAITDPEKMQQSIEGMIRSAVETVQHDSLVCPPDISKERCAGRASDLLTKAMEELEKIE